MFLWLGPALHQYISKSMSALRVVTHPAGQHTFFASSTAAAAAAAASLPDSNRPTFRTTQVKNAKTNHLSLC
jgi:hypothetical protein